VKEAFSRKFGEWDENNMLILKCMTSLSSHRISGFLGVRKIMEKKFSKLRAISF